MLVDAKTLHSCAMSGLAKHSREEEIDEEREVYMENRDLKKEIYTRCKDAIERFFLLLLTNPLKTQQTRRH
jgi:hypothetical protein